MALILKANVSILASFIKPLEAFEVIPNTQIRNPVNAFGANVFMTLLIEKVFERRYCVAVEYFQPALSTVIDAVEPLIPHVSQLVNQMADTLYPFIRGTLTQFANSYEDDRIRLIVFNHELLIFTESKNAGKRNLDDVAYATHPCGIPISSTAIF